MAIKFLILGRFSYFKERTKHKDNMYSLRHRTLAAQCVRALRHKFCPMDISPNFFGQNDKVKITL